MSTLCAALLAACGGGGGSSAPPTSSPPPASVSQADATRFLEQSSFGATADEISAVQSQGFKAYLNAQFSKPKTGYTGFNYVPHTAAPDCSNDPAAPGGAASICARDNYSAFQVQRQFFENALTAPDQLRQRVAFALSQIMVISSSDVYEAYGLAAYQNLLLDDAFVNFRQLLNDVTLSPGMGRYLDMVNNDKANAAQGTSPNENYARELMQLFAIGIYQLNDDGTVQKDGSGNPVATYDQSVVQGYAALFTGWTYAPLSGAALKFNAPVNYSAPMVLIDAHHDSGAKKLLNGLTVPAGQSGTADLSAGLDAIFNHPNVAPFIASRLIQHLVTSNPSPAYVARIAAVFNNDGSNVRGNLQAVVQAILLDSEARGDAKTDAAYGHLREPALFLTSFLRAVGGQSDGVYLRSQSAAMGQNVFSSGSVFNFYPPDYVIPSMLDLGPEFAIQGTATALARANFINQIVYGGGATPDTTVTGSTGTTLDLTSWIAAAGDADGLVSAFDARLTHGTLGTVDHQTIAVAVNAYDPTETTSRAQMAAYLFGASPQFQVER
jgi:uncharacterized protein (DUF1800 family)